MHLKQPSKVELAAIHHIERARLRDQDIEHIDLVYLAIADVNEGVNRAPEDEQGVQLHGGPGFVKRRPLEQAQTQVHGGGV